MHASAALNTAACSTSDFSSFSQNFKVRLTTNAQHLVGWSRSSGAFSGKRWVCHPEGASPSKYPLCWAVWVIPCSREGRTRTHGSPVEYSLAGHRRPQRQQQFRVARSGGPLFAGLNSMHLSAKVKLRGLPLL
ncbi:hypothetical protein NDU88_003204 [Pleurodeles waltl]|uniref:Uncharacterized protein n=1 Tax=Pleurodeles waltl TaxID=8319 RepID=A0AAV7RC83_PLEWA|nr:hypothetical protein NDU88_003204 [Pleurodeles waltl]